MKLQEIIRNNYKFAGIAAIDRVVFNLADLCILIGTMAVVLGT